MKLQSMLDNVGTDFEAAQRSRQAGDFDLARFHLTRIIHADPTHARALGEMAVVCLVQGQIDQAQEAIQRAITVDPSDHELAFILAAVFEAKCDLDRVDETLDRLMQAGDESSQFALLFAAAAQRTGREAEALRLIDRALRNETAKQPRTASSLHFAAAALLDRLGEYDQAFARAELANSLPGVRYDPAQVDRPIREWMEYFTRPTLRRLPHATHGSELPVFVVGMPRSGTTLVEQVLASHHWIHGGGELPWLLKLCQSVATRYPSATGKLSDSFDRLTLNDVDELAEMYLRPLAALAPKARRIINKLPTNFMHLGMIKFIFPQARVIYCRRDAMDTCLSCYMTDFATDPDFSAAQSSLGHFYNAHLRTMAHWKDVLDLPILDVNYEDMVMDVESQARRMLDFLDMPWDEHCLRFYENSRYVGTPSRAQVRKPIYRTSVGRWLHYEKHLGPLREALEGA